ncbi:hypothetical protein Goarm_009506, partial [Gossypium armourianum]|nr:hypothetical protein [Gossypium armourianum]
MKTLEDANAAIEKLNGTQIGGREIKVNITEKPLAQVDLSLLQAEDSQFVDSPHKVYVGNLAKTVTSETLKKFFSEKGKVMSAKVSRVPGSSKSGGFGFVSFSSDEEVEAAINSFNNAVLWEMSNVSITDIKGLVIADVGGARNSCKQGIKCGAPSHP